MPVVLRAAGGEFDVDRFCAETCLTPDAVYQRGAAVLPMTRPAGRRHDRSGLNVVVSEADFSDFPGQVSDAIDFLSAHRVEVSRLVRFPGVDRVDLDFGLAHRDVPVQSDRLPPELVRVAGELGLGVVLSHYPAGDEEAGGPQPVAGPPKQA